MSATPKLPNSDDAAGRSFGASACSAPTWLLEKTFCVEYSPNCPKRWLVRLPGKSAVIDKRQYFWKAASTEDALGFGDTFEEAATNALKAQNDPDQRPGKQPKTL